MVTPLSDADFVRAFERGDIANAEFRHASHLRLALAYLDQSRSVEEAIGRMTVALQRFATRAGKPEKYHQTITIFWMRMVGRLLDKRLPLAYYSPERLSSDEARLTWVEPDLRPLEPHHDTSPGSADPSGHAQNRPLSR
jgi:hypothetical protein